MDSRMMERAGGRDGIIGSWELLDGGLARVGDASGLEGDYRPQGSLPVFIFLVQSGDGAGRKLQWFVVWQRLGRSCCTGQHDYPSVWWRYRHMYCNARACCMDAGPICQTFFAPQSWTLRVLLELCWHPKFWPKQKASLDPVPEEPAKRCLYTRQPSIDTGVGAAGARDCGCIQCAIP